MKFGPSSYLGIALTDRAITCAEIAPAGAGGASPSSSSPGQGGRRAVRRAATFAIPQGLSLDNPQPLGQLLAAFLREKGFGAGRAAVGLPAKWLIAIDRDVPPAAEETAHGVLRMHAERLGVSESGEMVFDYAGSIDGANASKVLLVGVTKRRLDQVEQMCAAAGLATVGVTSAALALSRVAAARPATAGPADATMLLLNRQGGEFVWRHGASPRLLRHVAGVAVNGHGPVSVAPLGAELGRTFTLARTGGGSAGSRELILWDGIGLAPAQLTELSERSGLRVRAGDAATMLGVESAAVGVASPAEMDAAGQSLAPAIALALAAADRQLLPFDFTRSRLAERPKSRIGRASAYAIAAGVLLVASLVSLYVVVELRQSELNRTAAKLKSMEADVKNARVLSNRVNFAAPFFGKGRSPDMNCLKELTLAFRDDEPIWTTAFIFHSNPKPPTGQAAQTCQIQGKAADERPLRALVDRLKLNPKFGDVTGEWRDAGSKTREFTFTITFSYTAPE